MKNWRNDPMTEKQRRLIFEMNEFSEFPLPTFHGTTKGEASDWIDQNMSRAHEHFDPNEDMYGDWV